VPAVGPIRVYVPHVDQLVLAQQKPVLFEGPQAVSEALGVLFPSQQRSSIEYGFCGL